MKKKLPIACGAYFYRNWPMCRHIRILANIQCYFQDKRESIHSDKNYIRSFFQCKHNLDRMVQQYFLVDTLDLDKYLLHYRMLVHVCTYNWVDIRHLLWDTQNIGHQALPQM